jgi:mRNA interferase MazF
MSTSSLISIDMKGKIVVIPFPFTDLTSIKRRPALVLHETKYDVVVAYISSIISPVTSPASVLILQTDLLLMAPV